MTEELSPRDQFITIFGRNPVLEALNDPALAIDKVLVAHGAKGDGVAEIIALAKDRRIRLHRVAYPEVVRLSKSPAQDQGVVADVRAPAMETAERWFARLDPAAPVRVLALDGITTPANVGMIVRSAVAAGMDGILLPRRGTSGINPLVIKSSAGTIFRARLLRCERLEDALGLAQTHGVAAIGLEANGGATLFDGALPRRGIYVVGNESLGLSPEIRSRLDGTLQIPMAGAIDSLNVAVAASLLCFETLRRLRHDPA